MRGDGDDRVLGHAGLPPRGQAGECLTRGARALAALNRRLLHAYSRGCVRALRPSLRIALGPLEPVLALNVEKEARKDAAAIAAVARGAADVTGLLHAAEAIDRDFLARAGRFAQLLDIRYEDIVPIRRRRLERLLHAAAALLREPWSGIRAAARASYAAPEFRALLLEHLQLYAHETYALQRSVRLPALVAPVRGVLAGRLRAVMDLEARRLAAAVCGLLYE